MKHARRNLRRLVRLAAAGGLVCGGLITTGAFAADPGPGDGTRRAAPVTALVDRLGTARTAGSWTAADGRTVVAVTDRDAADEVREAGAEPRLVRHSADRLREATESLRTAPRVPGTAWAVDYASNEVRVRADRTVSSGDWSRMTGLAESIGDVVRMERTTGSFTTRVSGASSIAGDQRRCSAGFNVTDGQDAFILTAGHCGPQGTAWFRGGGGQSEGLLGTTTASAFPGTDYSLVRYGSEASADLTNVVAIGQGRGVRIVGTADATVGAQVFRSGSTTGFRTGRVTAVNATVNYPEGTVTGLIETTVCAEPGDSGGPLFSEGLAIGLTSGGDGDCDTGGTTYFQPVTSALEDLGVRLAGVTPAAGPDGTGAGEGTGAADGATGEAAGAAAGAAGDGAAAGGGTGNGTGTAPATGVSAGAGAVPGAAAPPGDARRVTSIVEFDDPGLGLGVIGVSLVVLVAARRIGAAQERRDFRSMQSATWG